MPTTPSGASGLFQTMPGWGSATVEDQIQATPVLTVHKDYLLGAY